MAILKCKMCGGTLEITEGSSVCTCEFCDTVQTLPTIQDEGLQNLFNRANVLRMKSEFDKAAEIYEKILQKSAEESEAYWGLILCKYGIEYVEDPNTFKRIPTCHRASYDSVIADEDYKMAIQYADASQKAIYEEEAKVIDEVQKGIIALAQKADPYDVFICYKETDENGQRTQDSVIANDIYYQLTQEGFKVFYAAITLEDKLGSEYEPYIFSALNTAKVLLSIGTKPEYFTAVWVKNEWSRFLKIMKKDRSKLLIPCYKDMDAYELPEEFAHLQAQDMSKIGFINDLVRGIKKVIVKGDSNNTPAVTTVVQTTNSFNVQALLDRGQMALEDGEWDKADGFYEEVLNQDAKCAEAYVGKLLIEFEIFKIDELKDYEYPFDDSLNYQKAMRFGTEELKKVLKDSNDSILKRIEEQRRLAAEEAERVRKEQERIEAEQNAAKEVEYRKALIYLGLAPNSEQESLIDEENTRHEQVYAKLQNELREAEITAKHNETALLANVEIEKKQLTEEYNQEVSSLSSQLDTVKLQHRDVLKRKKESLSSLGIFAMKQKKELQKEIESQGDIYHKEECALEERIVLLKENYNKNISILNQRRLEIHNREKEIIEKIKSENTLHQNNTSQILSGPRYYKEAIYILKTLQDYKESALLLRRYEIFVAKVGDVIGFGRYNWRVLEINGDKALVISENAVARSKYHNSLVNIDWSSCNLRAWLNNEFFNSSFSSEERIRIVTTIVSAGANHICNTKAGGDTEDRVFLLSMDEAEKHFSNSSFRCCKDGSDRCSWWLRSPGRDRKMAAYVGIDGGISPHGDAVDFNGIRRVPGGVFTGKPHAVRPAMWISLKS